MRQRLFTIFMVCWSLINCYTRLYLGVHYPGDILVGLSWGAIVGTSVYYLYRRVLRLTPTSVPATYTPAMCDIPIAVLVLTIVFALLQAYVQI